MDAADLFQEAMVVLFGKAQDEEFYRRQRELLGKVVAESDIVITAAVVPGKKSPVLVTAEMVKGIGMDGLGKLRVA